MEENNRVKILAIWSFCDYQGPVFGLPALYLTSEECAARENDLHIANVCLTPVGRRIMWPQMKCLCSMKTVHTP